jgi:hypothetical protein
MTLRSHLSAGQPSVPGVPEVAGRRSRKPPLFEELGEVRRFAPRSEPAVGAAVAVKHTS